MIMNSLKNIIIFIIFLTLSQSIVFSQDKDKKENALTKKEVKGDKKLSKLDSESVASISKPPKKGNKDKKGKKGNEVEFSSKEVPYIDKNGHAVFPQNYVEDTLKSNKKIKRTRGRSNKKRLINTENQKKDQLNKLKKSN